MIQINLLPDVKTNYIKAQRKKRMVLISAMTISGAALAVVVIMGSLVYGQQKLSLSNLDKDIKSNSAKLQKVNNLDKILTVQNQLNSLTGLHKQKPVTSRLFDFWPKIVPANAQLTDLKIDFDGNTMKFSGTSSTLADVNRFADILKFTEFTTDQNTTKSKAFSDVVLSSFSRTEKDATYSIDLKFNPILFSSDAKTVTVSVPNITSTRSNTESPDTQTDQSSTNSQGTR